MFYIDIYMLAQIIGFILLGLGLWKGKPLFLNRVLGFFNKLENIRNMLLSISEIEIKILDLINRMNLVSMKISNAIKDNKITKTEMLDILDALNDFRNEIKELLKGLNTLKGNIKSILSF